MENFDAEEFIDGWSESYQWREALGRGDIAPGDFIKNLRALQERYEQMHYDAGGFQDEEKELFWQAVDRTVESYVK